MELVERDAVGIWWFNRLNYPVVDLASFNEPYLVELQNFYQTLNRELWVLDLTTDLGIPTFTAVSRRTDGGRENIYTGFGTHLDPKIGILRAVTELNQMRFGGTDVNTNEREVDEWLRDATIENQPYLAPNLQVPPKVYSDYQQLCNDDIREDVLTCVEIIKQAGMETFVLDQTRPDIGLNVVKVIVPELRHHWSRFGTGRLYDVPVKMGWLSEPLSEEQMNPLPMVL